MKRILINATHNEEIRVALCKDNHLYDFDLENRTREQKKSNIYKGHITRVEPSLEAVFVEYGSARQGFLPLREISAEYLKGDPRTDSIRHLIKEGDEVIVQVEKEERGNKGAALSTYISLAGRYLVLMPNNDKAGGISRQISGKVREEMKQIINNLSIPNGMSVIVRTAGLGKGFDDLQNDLGHLLDIWASILEQNRVRPSPCLVHQEAGVVTRAVRDYLRDDISEVWIDSEHAYNEAANFIASVMPNQLGKLRKYTDYEPLFAHFNIERQIETAYQREVRLPSGGSIVIDQTEAMVAIDINSSKSTKGSDVAETAYHTNLEAADEIARQLRLRDMGGLIVIDFIDMNDPRHQKDVEKRLIDATRYDRARVQFAEISKFGLMEMSRQRLRPSLEESTGYICPRCHGNGMIRDLRSLALSIMRQLEQIALKERMGEIQAEVPTEIAAFLLNEKRESLVYLEQDSGVRITILPHAHLESPNFSLHFNPDGFAPSSYERIVDAEEKDAVDKGYDTNWHTAEVQQSGTNRWQKVASDKNDKNDKVKKETKIPEKMPTQTVAWLSNLFAPKPQANLTGVLNNNDVTAAIESIVNSGRVSLGSAGAVHIADTARTKESEERKNTKPKKRREFKEEIVEAKTDKSYKSSDKPSEHKSAEFKADYDKDRQDKADKRVKKEENKKEEKSEYQRRDAHSVREPRGEVVRMETLKPKTEKTTRTEKSSIEKEPVQKDQKTDVVLQVIASPKTEKTAEVVHLSLDNSKEKPKKLVQKSKDKAITKAQVESVKAIDNAQAQSLAQEKNHQQTVHVEETQSVSTPEDVVQSSKTQTKFVDTQFDITQIASDSVQPKTDAVSNDKLIDDSSQYDTSSQKSAALQLDQAKLAAIAQQMRRANNDPRVIAAYHQMPIAINGLSGEFIQKVLGDKASGDFVADFLLALERNEQNQDFDLRDFSNYGYAPLNGSYLAEFHQNTTPVGQFNAPQGKTAVTPSPICKRASNDPRGQHPDFGKLAENQSLQMVQMQIDQTEQVDTTAQITPQSDAADISQKLVSNVLNDVIENQLELFTEQVLSDDKPKKVEQVKPTGKKADDKKKSDNYKNMIEIVSDLMLPPQLGILNLVATPKKPKPAKPKNSKSSVNKKTSKAAQKSQVVKRKVAEKSPENQDLIAKPEGEQHLNDD